MSNYDVIIIGAGIAGLGVGGISAGQWFENTDPGKE